MRENIHDNYVHVAVVADLHDVILTACRYSWLA